MKRFPCLMLAFLLILSECTASAEELSGARPVFEAIQSGRSEDVYRLFSEPRKQLRRVWNILRYTPAILREERQLLR